MEVHSDLLSLKAVCIALTAIFAAIGLWFDSQHHTRSALARKIALCGVIVSFIIVVMVDTGERRSRGLLEANDREKTAALLTQIGRSVLGLKSATIYINLLIPLDQYPDTRLRDDILATRRNKVGSNLITYDHAVSTLQDGPLNVFSIDDNELSLLKDNIAPTVSFMADANSAEEPDRQDYLTEKLVASESTNKYAYVEQSQHNTNLQRDAGALDTWIGVQSKVTLDMMKTSDRSRIRSILDLNGAELSIDFFSSWFPGAGIQDDRRNAQVLRALAHGKLLSVIVHFDGYGGLCLARDDFRDVPHEKPIDIWRSGVHVLNEKVLVPTFLSRLPKDILPRLYADIGHCSTLRPVADSPH